MFDAYGITAKRKIHKIYKISQAKRAGEKKHRQKTAEGTKNPQDLQDLASEAQQEIKKTSMIFNKRPVVDKGIFSAFDRNGVKKFVLEER